jgi:hypothetical protein
MTSDDDRTLALLQRVLEAEAPQAPADRIAEIRARAISGRARYRLQAEQESEVKPGRPAVPPQMPFWAAAAASALLLLTAFIGGVGVGSEMPDWARGPAYTLGLPVDSPRLVQAREELDKLGNALARGDRREVAQADEQMVRLVKSLDEPERRKIEPVAHEVHLRAVEFLGQPPR